MKWVKKGMIFKTEGVKDWARSHTTHPIPLVINSDTVRIFYTSRDFDQRSRISFIDVNRSNLLEIKYIHHDPIFPLGDLGTYDDRGNIPSFVLRKDDKYYFYITGYNTANTARYRAAIGLAIAGEDLKFEKISNGPIMDRSIYDPCGVATPYVLFDRSKYRMWYTSFYKWELIDGFPEPFYRVRYAESNDALNWKIQEQISLNLNEDEGGIARPSVVQKNGRYYMLYSVRRKTRYREGEDLAMSYRVGMAVSDNGINWERKDIEVGIAISENGWDSEMMAYSLVFELDGKILMLYNGNGFGKSGFGLAELEIF